VGAEHLGSRFEMNSTGQTRTRNQVLTQKITCECGAVYERTEWKSAYRDNDHFNCQACGQEIESWNGSRIPSFRLVSRPVEPPE
jgi:hypothetical protein